jgi:hypothetical protein
VDKILDTFLLAYRTTSSATLPQRPAGLFFGRKPRTTLDLLLPTKQPTGHDPKMESQFNRLHVAVERNFYLRDPVCAHYRQSLDGITGSVAKRIGGRLYDVMLANGSTHRYHANQMRPRSTHLADDDFAVFADNFNLPARRPQATNDETSHVDEHAGDHNQQSSNQGTPALDVNPEEFSSPVPAPRRSKRGHIPKKQFELDPSRKSYKYP